jgi:pimeloyl-ACP methyl ester carboxylesterase
LTREWPVPLAELSLVGHSMGGLVSRSACHYAEAAGRAWFGKLRRLVCLGSPHHGALLEQGGNWVGVLLGVSQYSAPFARLTRIRSAGVTDLRYGNVIEEHWQGRERFGTHGDLRRELFLPAGVSTYFVAGTLSERAGPALRGDGMVSVDSALGRHRSPQLTLSVPPSHEHIAYGTGHVGLLSSADVYAALRGWFEA